MDSTKKILVSLDAYIHTTDGPMRVQGTCCGVPRVMLPCPHSFYTGLSENKDNFPHHLVAVYLHKSPSLAHEKQMKHSEIVSKKQKKSNFFLTERT